MMPEDKLMVTQADRDAAIGYLHSGKSPLPANIAGMAEDIASGKGDGYQLTQAFARHRIAAISATGVEGLLEALEKCAAIIAHHCRPDQRCSLVPGGEQFDALDAYNAAVKAIDAARDAAAIAKAGGQEA